MLLKQQDNAIISSFSTTFATKFHLKSSLCIITFCVSRRRREMYCGHVRLCVCLSVCGRMPTLLHRPGCNLGGVVGDAP